MISRFSKKQSSVALSTTEAEYIAACSASCQAVWLWKLLSDLFDLELEVTCIFFNNQNCEKLSENSVFHDKPNHIEIKFHYILDMVQRGAVKFQYVATDEQMINVLTKTLAKVKFEYFRERLGVLQIEVPRKRE